MTRFRDESGRVLRAVEGELREAIGRMVIATEGEAVSLVNRPQKTRRSKKTGLRYGTNPSQPGEPPKQVTGTLKREIASDVAVRGTEVIGRVGFRRGTPADYAKYLERETGTSRMAPRPFLRPALDKNISRFRGVLRDMARRLG